jgi:uncharacterized protein
VCAPVASITQMHPVMQVATLTLFDARFSDLEFSYGSEMFFASFGRGTKKSVRSLETPLIQMNALAGGDQKELLDAVNSAMTLLESGKQRQQTQRMINAWANSDLKDLQRFEEWCDCVKTPADRKFLQRINDDRNPGLAASIDKLMREGRKVFAAAGALHMVGAKPLPKLLAEMGYTVERVDFAQIKAPAAATKDAPNDSPKAAAKPAPAKKESAKATNAPTTK